MEGNAGGDSEAAYERDECVDCRAAEDEDSAGGEPECRGIVCQQREWL
ncbi:MAG: hypothetical protein ACSHYA_07365 [Opitutaceae bacterium]